MKKILIMVLALMLAFGAFACSSKPAASSGSNELQFNLDGQAPAKPPEPAKQNSNELNFQLDK